MAKKGQFHINEKDLAAARALSAMHPEYEDEDYVENDDPFTVEEARAMYEATGHDPDYTFGFSQDELDD